VVLNLFGVLGMSVMLDKTLAEAALLALPFAVGDTIKAVIAGLVTQAIARARPEALLSRV
jgi:biotin transport system substrate-specific component